MAKSLNRVQLLGNLTRDPELRYTPSGTPVCTFGLATNRSWVTDSGEKKEEAEFHRIVAWNKLAEICSQYLSKGRKVYVEGRLSTRNWNAQDGTQKTTTEIIISDMILIDSKRSDMPDSAVEVEEAEEISEPQAPKKDEASKTGKPEKPKKQEEEEGPADEEVSPEDIPF